MGCDFLMFVILWRKREGGYVKKISYAVFSLQNRGGLLVPYLIVESLFAILVITASCFIIFGLGVMGHQQIVVVPKAVGILCDFASNYGRRIQTRVFFQEMIGVIKAVVILMILLINWIFVSVIFVIVYRVLSDIAVRAVILRSVTDPHQSDH